MARRLGFCSRPVPLQAHWATQDEAFPIAGVDRLEAKFDAAWAQPAWDQTMRCLGQTLG